jgi:pilus assembly protein CpaC
MFGSMPGSKEMNVLGTVRAILLTMILAAMAVPGAAMAQGYMQLMAADSLDNRPVNLGVNKSVVIDLPRQAGDVLVSNPQIADAVLRTSTRLYLIGVKLGQASVFLFDPAGQQIASFDVFVEVDLSSLNQLLAESIPDGYVRAEAMNGNIVIRGQVASATSSSRAQEITVGMLHGFDAGTDDQPGELEKRVVNLLTITGEEQVALKVSIVEVQRSVVKQLGINVETLLTGSNFSFGTLTGLGASPINFPFTPATPGTPGGVQSSFTGDDFNIETTLRALEETSMLRTLAEPTLTAVSGETANFLAGGEFPVPVTGDDGELAIQFKPFGVNLAFTPVVLAPGRISLKVRSEVSDISTTGAINVPISPGQVVSIPATSVRRAETTVELPSGGAFVIAGLVQDQTRRAVSGLPWLQKLPVLGSIFSSKDFLADQTELVMIVTAYLVKPVPPQALREPGENLVMANDAEAYFLNRLTKVYGSDGRVPGGADAAQVGFTFD